jgi:hypothetical protein
LKLDHFLDVVVAAELVCSQLCTVSIVTVRMFAWMTHQQVEWKTRGNRVNGDNSDCQYVLAIEVQAANDLKSLQF